MSQKKSDPINLPRRLDIAILPGNSNSNQDGKVIVFDSSLARRDEGRSALIRGLNIPANGRFITYSAHGLGDIAVRIREDNILGIPEPPLENMKIPGIFYLSINPEIASQLAEKLRRNPHRYTTPSSYRASI